MLPDFIRPFHEDVLDPDTPVTAAADAITVSRALAQLEQETLPPLDGVVQRVAGVASEYMRAEVMLSCPTAVNESGDHSLPREIKEEVSSENTADMIAAVELSPDEITPQAKRAVLANAVDSMLAQRDLAEAYDQAVGTQESIRLTTTQAAVAEVAVRRLARHDPAARDLMQRRDGLIAPGNRLGVRMAALSLAPLFLAAQSRKAKRVQ